jgi:hypothetical protein
MFTGDILNGNRLIAEIKFRINLKWSVSVCGKAIDLEKIGLTNNFLITKGSIHGIIDTVKKFRYCKGIQDSENVALFIFFLLIFEQVVSCNYFFMFNQF